MPDAARDKGLDWFGGKNTQRGILLFMVRHAAEHQSFPPGRKIPKRNRLTRAVSNNRRAA
jgi:hypothetical protein